MQLHYELTGDDFAASQRLFFRRLRPLMFNGLLVYGALFLLLGLWELSRGNIGSALVPLCGGAWGLFYLPVLVPRSAKGSWKKYRVLHGPTTLMISSDGLEISNPMTRAFVRGEIVERTLEDAKIWMIFISPTSFYLVPKRAFASPAEREQFRAELSRLGEKPGVKAPLAAP